MLFFDTHCHLQHDDCATRIDEVLNNAAAAGVAFMTVVGWDWPSSLAAVKLAERYPGRLYAAIGIHPQDCLTYDEQMPAKLYDLAKSPAVVAIGEIGLDYYRDPSPQEVQKKVLQEQISLAKELGKPVVIHDRDAHGPLLEILKKENAAAYGGIMHCYSGSLEMAQILLPLGWEISMAGPLTFHNARQLPLVAHFVPLEHLLIETDSPYLSPEPWRGKQNEPARVIHVAAKMAEIKGIAVEKVAAQTTANARRVFQLLGQK